MVKARNINSTGVARRTSTAPIERAHSDRARSGSIEVILTTRSSLPSPRRRARRNGDATGQAPPQTAEPAPPREQADCSSLRASSDHRFLVGALRARRTVCLLPRISLRPSVARAGEHSRPWPQITPSNTVSPVPRSTHYSCPTPPPPLWPSPHTSPPGEQQSEAPARPTKWQTVAVF